MSSSKAQGSGTPVATAMGGPHSETQRSSSVNASNQREDFSVRSTIAMLSCLLIMATGCQDDGISVYRVPRPALDSRPATPAEHNHSTHRQPSAEMAWVLPAGWTVSPRGSDVRVATLLAPAGENKLCLLYTSDAADE